LCEAILAASAAAPLATAHAHTALANLAFAKGVFDAARTHYEAALRIRSAENDRIGIAFTTISLGSLEMTFGDLAMARELIKKGFLISADIGLTFGLVVCHMLAGEIALREGRPEDAQTNYVEGLKLERSANNPQYRAQLLRRAGSLALRMGKPEEAEKHHSEALELFLDLGDQRAQAQAYIDLGEDSLALDNLGEARDRFLRGVRLATAFASSHLQNLALLGLARVETALGNEDNAAHLVRTLAGTDVAQKEAAYATLVDALGDRAAASPPYDLEEMLALIADDTNARALRL
jgi:tetratricopeptide (TPR) repeat protein